ncbi:dual E2 ubiquitin-conjugating enzyme/E3 ubiquitin-protein ligase BIRC6 [Odontesthes bonariensis]|uniref:dual E2 ubiquitin-conjugating enzyme/E3 ubiquitin-protein ligase BIRC6 n=1 Tax=Odontesthes bonariensis TaxID=219752 RepID=UPI003F5832EA
MAAAASPGSGSSTSSDWIVLRDGCLRCDEEGLRSLSYHPALNAILAVTSRGSIKVIDGTSGAILQASALHAKPGGRVRCQYFPAVDKVIFVDDYAVGCRKDLNGILLLDTALQPPVAKPEDMVQLELPVTEAQQMLLACQEKIDVSNTEGYEPFITQLKEGLKNTSHETAANHKVAKWATVTFHLPHHVLKLVVGAIVNELKKINQNIAALSVASSIMDRLSYLLSSARPELGVGPGRSVDRSLMYSEANRRETFTSWPHAGYRWAQPDPMAQAGFYHQPASTGDDRAMCFTCSVCLVCWEPTDEPWSEHERHSPNCPFVKGEHTQNVPLSVTLATSPAQFPNSPDSSDKIACYGFGSCPQFLAAATKRGKICIWDVSKIMKVHLKFDVNPYDPAILRQLILCSGEQGRQAPTESQRPTLSWLEESSSCSDLPKLEGDSDDQLEDSDSDDHSRSESVTGQSSQWESMDVSLGVTALSVLQQPEKLQWEVVASVLEDTVKDLEELGVNPSLNQTKSHSQAKAKDKVTDLHNIPFPCLLAGGLLSYRSPSSTPMAGPSAAVSTTTRRTTDGPLRTQGTETFFGPLQEQGPMEIESCNPQTAVQEQGFSNLAGSQLPSPSSLPAVRRTIPVLLLYSIREVDDKSSGQVFAQMNNLMSKGLHDEGFTVPQIIEMEFDTHEQLLLQDPPITYIQQFADAATNLTGLDGHMDKWSTLAAATVSTPPRPGALVQCLRLPKHLEEENLYVDSITPCWDGVHLLVGLQPCGSESFSASNQVEALNNINRLHSALCSQRKGDPLHPVANGVEGHHPGGSPPQTPLILPPADQQQQRRSPSSGGGGGYLALYKLNYSTRIVTLDEEPIKVQQIKDPCDTITSLILLPPDVLDSREDDSEETPEETVPSAPKNGSSGLGTSLAGFAASGTGTACGAANTGSSAAITSPSTSASSHKECKRVEVTGLGHLVVTTQAGYIMILDLSTLEALAKVEPPKKEGSAEETDPFVSVIYCSGTDRLCACTKGGELHFLQIGGVCDDIDDGDMFIDGPLSKGAEMLLEGAKPSSNPSSPGITGVDLLVDQLLTTESLMSLVEMTRFETLTPRFSATVPPCWVEVQQEQQQRRHPQHLHQQHHGDAAQHTRTWKLQSDSSSWDEHVFELVLPKACMVGHVDFKFVLNANIVNIPQIQVTLLKNKAPGLGKVSETAVDRQISFPLSNILHANGEKNGQPLLQDFTEDIQFMDIEETSGSVLCPFLEDHKEDILCGPVWLASGLDLSGHSGMLSLTSPKLVKGMAGGKYRSFLVHIKAVSDSGMEESPRPVVRMPSAKPQSSKAHSLSTLLQRAQASKEKVSAGKTESSAQSKKVENLRGCDLLQEVSVTIRRFKKTSVPKERIQRCAMLQFPDFHEKLLDALCQQAEGSSATEHAQSLILDILCWLAGVFSNGPCSIREGKEGLLVKTRMRLMDIVRVCFFEAGRSIAHKCARFLALCISNGKGDSSQQGFGMSLLKALLDNMPYLPAAATGGSVFWYFVLLNYVKEEDLAGCSTACASLLTAISRQLQDRLTPLEALLQTRYGLYSSPFDPVLFDLEVSGSSCKNAFNSSIGVQSDEIDLSDILSGNGKASSCAAAEGSFTALTGLLEVEPLHFTCISTSDGTRVERDDASMFTVSTFGVTPAVGGLTTGTVGEASTALSSAAQVALQSLSHAMVSAEQQLQVLQEKQQQLLKLQQQKAKLEAKLHQTTSAAAAVASGVGPIHNSVPSNPSSAPGFFIHPSDVIPPTPKTTPLFMTPPLTPPNEAVSAAFSAELAHLFPGSMMDPGPVNLAAHKNTQRAKSSPMGSGLALAISQASHFLQPPPHQSIIIERMHSARESFIWVFMLLSCIGQRSLSNSGVLEGLLNLLDSLLSPLQQPYAAAQRRTEGVLDIPMISWVVMLVSRLLDYVASIEDEASGGKKNLGGKERDRPVTGIQWSFINNSFQSQSSSRSSKGSSSLDRLYSRKIRKQLVHHKQQLNLLKAKQKALVEQIEKEKIQSNKGSSYKLLVEQAKLKQATSKHFKDLIRLRRTAEWPRSTLDAESSTAKEAPEVEPLPFTLSHERCISVVQKLALFLLSMDFTCHADLLLFVCKVLARIANATRPTIHLCEVVSEQQLERLLLLLVGTDFNRGDISWGGAWAQYSLTCMLQDILAGELLSPGSLDAMDEVVVVGEEAGASSSTAGADSDDSLPLSASIPLVESIDEALVPDIIAGAPPLSSLEKDKDIDFDLLQDLMDVDIDPLDIDLEKDPLAAKVFKPISSTWYDYWGADYGTYGYNPYIGGVGIPVSKPPAAAEKPGSQGLSVSVSQALDARLEVGLEQQAELMLKMMATLQADSILQALTSSSSTVSQPSNGTDDSLLRALHGGGSPPSSSLMIQPSSIPILSACFNKLFSMLQVHHVQLESLLQLWLTLSLNTCSAGCEESGSDIFLFNASRVPTIPLNQASISSFLTVLAWYPNTSLRTWCLVLHSLTLMTNMPACAPSSGMSSLESTAQQMVSDPTLVHVLVRFLSGSSTNGTSQHSSQVGPTATQAMHEFLSRLQVHLSSTCPQMFSEFLLKLMHILSTERGPFQSGQGPLDAQVKLLEFTLEQNFEVVSVATISSVIESITFLVHHYITCSDKVVSRSGSDSSVGARACFGGLFANIIRPGDAKAVCGETTRDQLMFNLLKLVNVLVQLPLSGDREFSGRLPPVGSGAADSSVSDEEKVCGSKESVAGGSSTSQGPPAGVADLVLANQQIMSQILSALGQCNSSAMAMIIGASGLHLTKHENFHGGLDAISVGDGLFTILTTLSKRATSVQVMLQPILTYMACGYMGRQGSLSTCQLSEPLLWFILRVLDTSEALKAFHDMGGVQLICNNMVTSTRAIVNTARSMVSTIMKFLDSGPGKAADGNLKARVMTSEPDNAEGLHNFAPLGTITSSSPTAQPAEVLLQATPPHRRARSAAWSYIFLPEEAWCDLTIHLPAAVLLKELHIQPHLASLATCPSSVSVEISADGVNMLPLSTPVITSGLTYIKIQLVKAEVASAVCLRLHRPRDASTLGLSQIKLLGLTAFGNTSSATVNNPFLPSEDQVSKTSIGWLRLLHHCLTHVSDLEAMMASAAAPTANLLQTCAALLMSPYCGMHSPNIEAVLVKIGLQSTRIGLKLIDILLRNCAASGNDPASLNSPLLFGRLNGLSSDSTIDILYQLGTTQDSGTKDRIQALLQWVHDSSRVASHKMSPMGYTAAGSSSASSREYGLLMPSPSHLHCVAAILWHSYELPVDYDLPALLNRELFELLYNWSMSLPCNIVLKKAVDSLLCSMCHIHPSYFSLLMSWMGIVSVPSASHSQAQQRRLAMTDDGKKQHDANASATGLTDDSKHARPPVNLSESQLTTLAAASQSPGAIEQLLDSGLPSLLVRSLAQFCVGLLVSADLPLPAAQADRRHHHHHYHSPSSSSHSRPPLAAELAAPVLRFLTEVGNSHTMKDWLGGPEVNPLWTALLFLLCHSSASASAGTNAGSQPLSAGCAAGPPPPQPHHSGSRFSLVSSELAGGLTTQQRTALENATVAFFLQCISCHPNNQRLMAQVLCELFQSAPQRGNVPISGNISGFIRRLFLQLMLEDEKVTVFLQSPCPLYKGRINATSHMIQHPMYGAGHKYRTLHLPISTTLAEVLDRVSDTPSITAKLINEQKEDKEKKNHEEKEKMKADSGFQDNYSVVVASGLKSQSKRALSTPPRPPSRRGRVMSDKLSASSGVDPSAKTISVPVFHLYHKLLPGQPLPPEMTLAQLLTLLYDRKLPQGYQSINLTVKLGSKVISDPGLSKTDSFKRLRTEKVDHCDMLNSCPEDEPMMASEECLDAATDESLLETNPIQSPLQVFAGMGGLALIAERLPMLYPDVIQQVSAPVVPSATQEKPKDSDQFEWVTIEQSGELVYEAPESIATEPPPINKQQSQSSSSSSSSVQTMSPIPAHSLAAFGLFLRLPGYAEVLLKERKHAQCLLRLVLGVTDDGEGSHILQSPSANVLPTLPFHVLRALFSSTPLTTDDGVLLRRMALEIGAIHLILACLSALSHHAPRNPNASSSVSEPQMSSCHGGGTSEEQQLYWAKGTGFGTGSTASGWDVEQALTKQRLEEEHVTCLLQVLASYINPASSSSCHSAEASSADSRAHNSSALPAVLQELLSQSCLIPAMSSYLRNDSVLDMARHVPLYRALLELLRAISTCTALVPLLLPLSGDQGPDEEEEDEEHSEGQTSVGMLLAKMKTCVDTYTNRLRSKKDKSKGVVKTDGSDTEPEGLTLLVPDIQRTAEIVYAATTSLRQANQERKLVESSRKVSSRPKPLSILRSLEEKYVAAMKKLQFDTFEMVTEDEEGKLMFKVNYHYMSQVKNASDTNSAARSRRLAQEAVTLSTSLPLSSSSSVFVRCDEERLDIMKVLITGPADTPYANGCFEFDVYFPQDYPNSPPLVNLETTGGHSVRFNPNLYNDGKVCLSILNTWHGRPEEKWNPQTSSFLQVLVSVQSLILVAEPYFNEPGYERSRGTPSGTQSSREYDGNIRQATVKWAMLEQMRNPSPCFKEVIHKHFYLKRTEIMSQCEEWITDIQQYSSDKRVGRTMSHHAAALKRHTTQLREELLKLPCPDGLEPDSDEFSEKSAALILKELPSQEGEKPGSSQDSHCSDGQL